jgi:ABC-type sugar transport system ATPase subunit
VPEINLNNVTKAYPSGTIGAQNVTLCVTDGELLALVGPSGCGKTTLLRLIAGLEQPDAGTISIGGQLMNGRPPHERNVGMVFQRPALYPNRTVRDNLAFSLKLRQGASVWRRISGQGRQFEQYCNERVNAAARLLRLEGELDRFPAQLSGGQQQRVALGRVLVLQPNVLLLDEPLSNIDAGLRQELGRELHLIQRQLHATMILVTHDIQEATSTGDRVAVMEQGRICLP